MNTPLLLADFLEAAALEALRQHTGWRPNATTQARAAICVDFLASVGYPREHLTGSHVKVYQNVINWMMGNRGSYP